MPSVMTLPVQNRILKPKKLSEPQKPVKPIGSLDNKPLSEDEKLDLELVKILQYLQLQEASTSDASNSSDSAASIAPNAMTAFFGYTTIDSLKKTGYHSLIDGLSRAQDQDLISKINNLESFKKSMISSEGYLSSISPFSKTSPSQNIFADNFQGVNHDLEKYSAIRSKNLQQYMNQARNNGFDGQIWNDLRNRVTFSNFLSITSALTSLASSGIDYWNTQKYGLGTQNFQQNIANKIQEFAKKVSVPSLSDQEQLALKKDLINNCNALIDQQNARKTGLEKSRSYLKDLDISSNILSFAASGVTIYGLAKSFANGEVSKIINATNGIYDNKLLKPIITSGLLLTTASTTIGTALSLYGIGNYAYQRLYGSKEIKPKHSTTYDTLSSLASVTGGVGTLALSMTKAGWDINSLLNYGIPSGGAAIMGQLFGLGSLASGIYGFYNLTKSQDKTKIDQKQPKPAMQKIIKQNQ